MKNRLKVLLLTSCIFIIGCYGATGIDAIRSDNPIERGCGYIAAAIVTNAIIRAIFK